LITVLSGQLYVHAQIIRFTPVSSWGSFPEGTKSESMKEVKSVKILKETPGKDNEDKIKKRLTPVARAKETLSEFEKFISGKLSPQVSTELRQFGYEIFFQRSPFYSSTVNVPVSPDYVIGPGDELKITVWGKIEGEWSVVVDRDGSISLPKIGVVTVAGLTFKELKEFLYKEMSKYYTGFQMNVSLGTLKTITVYVVGNARQPGAYTLSSLSTLVNGLIETGGPSKTGTLRNIHLKRGGKTIVHFDMYEFLLKGDKSKDIRLMPEDVIFIPPVGPLAAIAGNVKRPAIYELKGETRLLDLIEMAGGLANTAFKGRVQVQRIKDHRYTVLFEADLIEIEKDPEKNFLLKDGDLIKVFPVVDARQTVRLEGAVFNPGEYAITEGKTTIKDLIQRAGGLRYYASNKAELTRLKITPEGPVTEVREIDLSGVMREDPAHNLLLQRNDYLLVRSIPEWKKFGTVIIKGEVRYPGKYTIRKGETLSSLIERAGGYTERAYLRGAIFIRKSVQELQQKNLENMIRRLEQALFSETAAKVSTALSREEIEARKVQVEQKRRFIESLKRLRATGRMSIKLAHLRLLKGSEYDIELRDGDKLFIPAKNNVVNVIGAVMSPGSFIYSERLGYKDYLEMAGGYTRFADKKNVYVLKVDGSARKLSQGLFRWNSSLSRWEMTPFGERIKEIEPGDTIVVPEKIDRIAWLREIRDITQILYQIAVSAGVVIQIF